jgi:hypothetical protein
MQHSSHTCRFDQTLVCGQVQHHPIPPSPEQVLLEGGLQVVMKQASESNDKQLVPAAKKASFTACWV